MFLTVEGIEGAGKSTFIGLLENELTKRGVNFLRTREPGGCALGQQIRPLLLDVSQKVSDRAELFLFLADRAQHVADTIRPALERGQWVICDRYADSTIAYQGYGRGMDPEELQSLNDYATDGLWPNITFLLDLPVEEGLGRALARNGREGCRLEHLIHISHFTCIKITYIKIDIGCVSSKESKHLVHISYITCI